MNKPEAIRITDLAKPEYSALTQEMLNSVASLTVDISVKAIYAIAAEQLGDIALYEDDGLKERLGIICDSMNEDGDLNSMGRMTNQAILVRYLVQRCRLEDLYRRHPEIENVEIEKPIIIAGLPRSGTTHMLNLISVDSSLRSLSYWESLEPIPVQEQQRLPEGREDPRIQRCRKRLQKLDQIMPLFRNMHEVSAEYIHEEVELMGMDYSMNLFETLAILPRWRDYYLAHDQTPHYRFLKRALKALQWLRGPKRWILKSPQHMEQLIPLKTVFPDATFVLPHRDPVSVITSMATMQTYVARLSRDPVRPEQIGAYWANRLVHTLQQCARDRDQLPVDQTIDIMFHEFMADDIATIVRIYQLADHVINDETLAAMGRYMQDHPRGKHGRIVYDLQQDFGIDPTALQDKWAFYYRKFPVKVER